jgi:hypothetical protein
MGNTDFSLKIYKMNRQQLIEYIWSNQKSKKHSLQELSNMNLQEILDIALNIG